MKVLICGIDGYIGWPLALRLIEDGHEVKGFDDLSRRTLVDNIGGQSVIPIDSFVKRMDTLNGNFVLFSLHKDWSLSKSLFGFKPDAVIHLAEQASAPWSMANRDNCIETHTNNVIGTLQLLHFIKEHCPEAHLIKLGTMGEYGTPNVDIPEGDFEVTISGRKDILPFPKQPNSWYHLTKVHDSNNIMFACRNWGIRCTDIMQGIVFGVSVGGAPITRFDCDEFFGTVVNRFCAQAVVGHPITVYGSGNQARSLLPLGDSIDCISLVMENLPATGEYRVLNQFASVYSIKDLANRVCTEANKLGLNAIVRQVENPRKEKESHYYEPVRQKLLDMGYKSTMDVDSKIRTLLEDLLPFKNRIDESKILPGIWWDGRFGRQEVKYL